MTRVMDTALAALAVMLACLPTLVSTNQVASASSSGSISSQKSKVAQLQQEIAQQGDAIQSIVVRYDEAVANEEGIHAKLLDTQAQLVSDQQSQAAAGAKLRQLAVYAFVTGSDVSSPQSILSVSNPTSYLVEQEYAQAAGDNLQDAIDSFETAERATNATEGALASEQSAAQQAVADLATQNQAAQVALASENDLLGRAKGNLKSLLAAAAAARAAQEQAEEEALAAAEAQAAAQAAPAQVDVTPTPGNYGDPLRAINALNSERIDQGVDFSGYGPIYAVGDGVVLSSVNGGWPGGTFIAYRLTDGPAAGLVVYAAEDIYPDVSPGQTVSADTQIGTMYEGPDGIETGWADPSGDGTSMANDYGQFSGTNSTAFGGNFSTFLNYLGSPGGVLQNDPPTGSLPPGWPAW